MPKTSVKGSKDSKAIKTAKTTKTTPKKNLAAKNTKAAKSAQKPLKTSISLKMTSQSSKIEKIEVTSTSVVSTSQIAAVPVKVETGVPTPRNGMSMVSSTTSSNGRHGKVSRGFSLSNSKFSFRKNGATETVKVSQTQIEFKVGDNAVYPGHGVGTVMAIEAKEISGKKLEFYVVQMKETGMRVLVPKGNTSSVGLRPIISKTEAEKVMSILKDHPVKMDHQTWNRRYREYMEKIRTGSIYEIAEVLRALVVLRADKELSYGERNMLENARKLLMVELSLAVEKSELESRPEMREMLGL